MPDFRNDPTIFAGTFPRDVVDDLNIDGYALSDPLLQCGNKIVLLGMSELSGRHDLHYDVISSLLNNLRLAVRRRTFTHPGDSLVCSVHTKYGKDVGSEILECIAIGKP